MKTIEFTQDETALLVDKLKRYFDRELDQELGQFDAEFLLDFISKDLGAYYYNRGLMDARLLVESKLDDIDAGIVELEQVTEFTP